jgi:tetratricopeptide (TPR) repeat protein
MQHAEVAEAQGRLVEAASRWQEAFEASGGRSTRAARGLARVLSARGDADGALRILVSTLPPAGVEDVTDAQFLEDLAAHYFRIGARDQALSALEVAVVRGPDRPSPPILLAELLVEMGQAERAIEPLLRSIDLRPGHRPTHMALAGVLGRRERWLPALEEYQVAASLAPLGVAESLRATRSVLALPQGERRVRWALRVTAWLEVHGPPASQRGAQLRALGELYLASGKALEACTLLERVAGTDPGDAPTMLALTRAYLQSEQCQRALATAVHAGALELTEQERAALEELQAAIKEAAERIEATAREDSGDDQRGP